MKTILKIKRFYPVVVAFTVLIQVSMSTPAMAEVKGPGWFCDRAERVSLEKSKAYYQNLSPKKVKALSTFTATRTMSVLSSSTAVTPEITELARALHYDPKLIYDYVHNYIDYLPYFGSLKGATQTLLDGSGNDFDQASLMVALLRASGYTADFVHGTKYLFYDTLANWLGVEDWISTNRSAILDLAAQVWASGGIPISASSVALVAEQVWVKVTIDGTDYLFDPSYKRYINKSKTDIGSAIGYNRTELINAATQGAAIDTDSVRNLNQANLNDKLTEYTTNLVNVLRSQYPNSDVRDIIGGRQIEETHITRYSTSLPLVRSVIDTWTDIPTSYIATLRIQHQGIDCTFKVPEIAGKRLTITYTGGSFIPELRLDGILIASGNSTTQGNRYDMIISVDHPYVAKNGTYMDQTATYKCISGSTYAIVTDFAGGATDNLIRKRQKELSQSLASGLSDSSEQVLGETLNIMGLTWMKEVNLTNRLMNRIADTIFLRHHAVGLMAQERGYYIDVKMAYSGSISKRTIGWPDGMASFMARGALGSAFEHAILEQLMGSDKPGVSTIKLMQIANNQGSKVFWANSENFTSIQPQLRNYSSETLSNIQNEINTGKTVILPDNGQLSINQWQGVGYASKYIASDMRSLGMIISGGYLGGYGSVPASIDPVPVHDNNQKVLHDISYDLGISTPRSSEPVDMATGAYTYDHIDIALGGSAPNGLGFHRSYNSSRNRDKRSIGYGWQHNYDISIGKVSDGNPGIGLRTPVDAAAMITNLYIAEDLMRNEDNITGWMVMFLAHKWAVDQLIDNAVSINIGGEVTEYIKLPDGSYNNPPGITTKLVDNGNGTFSLKERFGAQMDFDTSGRITQLQDVDRNTLNFTYSGDKLVSVHDTVDRSLTLDYSEDNLVLVMDSEGRSLSYNYDESNNLISCVDVAGKTWAYRYDDEHRMTNIENPLGITTVTNTYDALDRVKTQVVPRDGAMTASYNFYFSGFRNAEEDPFGRQTIYYLDEKGRTYAVEGALLNKTTKTFDGQNHAISIKDARGYIAAFTYDDDHNLTQIKNAYSQITANTYDSESHLTDTADPLGHTAHFDYDSEHHLIQTIDAVGNAMSLAYYSNGQLEATTDARGTITTLTYDSNNLPSTTTTGSHPPICYSYDAIGRMLELTDQEGATTRFTYDSRGLLLSRTDPLGKTTRFTYDDAGRLTSRTDRKGDTTTYTYTPSDKLKTITYADGSRVVFTYDLHNKLISMQDTTGITIYTYDSAYRLKSVTNPYGQIVSYEYDQVGNVTKIIYPDNKVVSYTYDALNRLETVKNWLSQTATYSYDDAGRLTSVINCNGTATYYTSDDANRLVSLQNKRLDTETVLSSYTYTLDGNGNRTQVLQEEMLPPVIPSVTTNFTYNSTKNRLFSAGSTDFTYDDEGQLASKDDTSYSFDYEHRLVIARSVSDEAIYTYDGKGNRLQATRNGLATRYIYDASGKLLAETDSDNAITRYYIYGRGLLAMATPTNQVYTYHYNGIGSTIAITNQNKTVFNRYFYTPFGLITNQDENIPQPFKYAGKYGIMYEKGGLYYMRARYYDPEMGRFISEDPSGFGGGVNLYAYCNNNPISYVDPLGLEAGEYERMDRRCLTGDWHCSYRFNSR